MSLRLAIALALLTAAPAVLAEPAAKRPEPAWVTASNADTTALLKAQAVFSPEDASSAGLTEYDGLAVDLGPDINNRYIAAMEKERTRLQARLAVEKDGQVKQDHQILID